MKIYKYERKIANNQSLIVYRIYTKWVQKKKKTNMHAHNEANSLENGDV